MSLEDGMKGRYIFLPHTSIQIIQTDMQATKDNQNKSEELQHGILFSFLFFLQQPLV